MIHPVIYEITGFHTGDMWYKPKHLAYVTVDVPVCGLEWAESYAETLPGFVGFDVGGNPVRGAVRPIQYEVLNFKKVDEAVQRMHRRQALEAEKQRIEVELAQLS